MLWIYCQKSIHHTTYKASISEVCLCDQILNHHFNVFSLIIKRLTLLLVVVAAKTKRAKVKRRKAKKVILYFNLKWLLFLNKFTEAEQKCCVHCIIVPHKPPPGSQLIFVCIFVTRESWAWKTCSACVISAPAHTGGFSLLVLHKFWGCSWVCKSDSDVSAAEISCDALHDLLPWQLPASHQHLQHQSSTGFCQGHQREASWEAEEDTGTGQGGRGVHHYHPPPHSLTQPPSAHAPCLFVNWADQLTEIRLYP